MATSSGNKAMKLVVEVDLYAVACPGTFLRETGDVYVHVEMFHLQARTKSVTPTFPLFFQQRLRFEKLLVNCFDPGQVTSELKSQDIILELHQYRKDIASDGVIAHCSSNAYDFFYPSISLYFGTGREIMLYKTSRFRPLRVTGEPVKLEYSTNSVIKETFIYDTPLKLNSTKSHNYVEPLQSATGKGCDNEEGMTAADETDTFDKVGEKTETERESKKKIENTSSVDSTTPGTPNARSTPNTTTTAVASGKVTVQDFFSTLTQPKIRSSKSPPSKSPSLRLESTTVGDGTTSVRASHPKKHARSSSTPVYTSAVDRLRDTLDDMDLNLAASQRRRQRLYRSITMPHASSLLHSSRYSNAMSFLYGPEDVESDLRLDMLRRSLREERDALNDVIKTVDREALYRSLNRTR